MSSADPLEVRIGVWTETDRCMWRDVLEDLLLVNADPAPLSAAFERRAPGLEAFSIWKRLRGVGGARPAKAT